MPNLVTSPGAFELYAHLRSSPPKQASPLLKDALSTLRLYLHRHGNLCRENLDDLPKPSLAHRFAEVALAYNAFEEELKKPLPVGYQGPLEILRWIENLYDVQERAHRAHPILRAHDLEDPDYVARIAVLCMSYTAWNHSPGLRGSGPTTFDVLSACLPEQTKLAGLYERMRSAPVGEQAALTAQLAKAERETLRAGFCNLSSGEHLQASLSTLDAPAADLFREQTRLTQPDVFEKPHQNRSVLLTTQSSSPIAVSAFQKIEEVSSPTPLLDKTVDMLREKELLDPQSFNDVELWVHTHGLISLSRLLEVLRDHGLQTVNVQTKGVSTNPIIAHRLRRWCTDFSDGYGSAELSPREFQRQLALSVRQSARWAKQRRTILLGLGDGMEAAQAFMEGVPRHEDLRSGYVEFTTSGVNALRSSEDPCDATCLGMSDLKHTVDAAILGPWLVDYDTQLTAKEGGKPLKDSRVVVVGGGTVGKSVAQAVKKHGCKNVVVVETNKERAKALSKEFFVANQPLSEEMIDADVYYSCVGFENTWSEAMLRKLPAHARVCNFASRGEVDQNLLHRAIHNVLPGCKTTLSAADASMPDHRTLALDFGDGPVFIRHLGLPLFDAKSDKDPMLADIYMSGLLASLCEQLQRIRLAKPPSVRPPREDLQRAILEIKASIYPDASA